MTDTATVQTVSHVRTISRMLAHRCAIAEVFVTSLHRQSSDEFVVGAQLPRMHAYYGDRVGPLAERYDPLLVMEAGRQAAIALTHEFFGVPQDMGFIVRRYNGTVVDTDAWSIDGAPADLVMTVRVARRHMRDEMLCGLDVVLDIERDDVPMMTVDGSFTWVTPTQWSGLRAGFRESLGQGSGHEVVGSGERAAPDVVGRENRRNVVITPPRRDGAGATAEIVADTEHPSLFDHPLDHVPGSLLLEAARQVGVSTLRPHMPRLLRVDSAFDRFVELDHPAECRAEIVAAGTAGCGHTTIRCEIRQCGASAARIELEFGDEDGRP